MQQNDTELIKQAQGGNVHAFEELVYRYDKRVLSIASQYVTGTDDAKDIYQEVFLRVHRSLKQFEFRSEFSTWLHRITVNVCLTHKARNTARPHVSLEGLSEENEDPSNKYLVSSEPPPDELGMASEIKVRVRTAVDSLAPQQRMVFTLKHYEGYKLREIAVMMDCTEGTVKRYLFLATRELRNQLRGLHD